MVQRSAPEVFRLMNGVFAVYKHAQVSCKSLEMIVTQKVIKDLDSMQQRPQKNFIQYLPFSSTNTVTHIENKHADGEQPLELENEILFKRVPKTIQDWFDHPLVQGSRYTPSDLSIFFGHILDKASSGVQLIGFQSQGEEFLKKLARFQFPRSYHLHGRFGQASTSFDGAGRVIEKSTWDHITEARITRLLCLIQGTFRNACIQNSDFDLGTQRAYEMASKGLLRPTLPGGPVVLDLKLHKLDLPDFVVDVTCINESAIYLRKLVHEIGLEMKSSAVCTKVRRYRDALFFAEDDSTFLTKDVNATIVSEAITRNKEILEKALKKRPAFFQNITITPQKEVAEEEMLDVMKT